LISVFLLAILFNALEADWPEMHIQDSWSVGLVDRSVGFNNQCIIGFSSLDGNFLAKNLGVFQEIYYYKEMVSTWLVRLFGIGWTAPTSPPLEGPRTFMGKCNPLEQLK